MAMLLSSPSGWASLPEELLDLILDRIESSSFDYFRCSAVCMPWRSVALGRQQRQGRLTRVPMLLIPTKDRSRERRGLYSVTQNKVLSSQLRVPNNNLRCCGSSHGWLAASDKDASITLLNPFSGRTILLPPVTQPEPEMVPTKRHPFKHQYEVVKVVLSADPCLVPKDYVVVAIYTACRKLAYIKPGQSSSACWTYLEGGLFMDAICHLGKIYVLHYHSSVFSLDPTTTEQLTEVVPPTLDPIRDAGDLPEKAYIVESSKGDDLLVVHRFLKETDHPIQWVTSKFKVLKLSLLGPESTGQQVEINSLGDDALFLGDNYSLSVSASNLSAGCLRPNCIYYMDDYEDSCAFYEPFGPRDTGIYSLQDDGTFSQHYQMKSRHRRMPPPIWIVPPFLV